MPGIVTIKINFTGGIISPGELYNILVAATRAHIRYVSFGLRQQLLIKTSAEQFDLLAKSLTELKIIFEDDQDKFPNIISSYPAEEVFIRETWLSEGVYKDIFDEISFRPSLKINISDSNQSFTPMLTGNINWVAAPESIHFWHLFIRFPKTNTIYEWDKLVYTNDIGKISQRIEQIISNAPGRFVGNANASGKELFDLVNQEACIIKNADHKASLPAFNLPYYEGLNRYNNKYWLGVYRRDETFSIDFLKEICLLCLETKIGQLCSTSWKSIIIKGIEEKDKLLWNRLLEKYHVNMRHAANELNFQVEDNCEDGLNLKNYLVKRLNDDDIRTFGICIGIKTRRKSEVFSSILVRRRPLLRLFGKEFFFLYDILYARDFNPNERTGTVFSKSNPKFLLPEQLRRSIVEYYDYRAKVIYQPVQNLSLKKNVDKEITTLYVHQCIFCKTVYDQQQGDPDKSIEAGVPFEDLPANYQCPLCEAEKKSFQKIPESLLGFQVI